VVEMMSGQEMMEGGERSAVIEASSEIGGITTMSITGEDGVGVETEPEIGKEHGSGTGIYIADSPCYSITYLMLRLCKVSQPRNFSRHTDFEFGGNCEDF